MNWETQLHVKKKLKYNNNNNNTYAITLQEKIKFHYSDYNHCSMTCNIYVRIIIN